MSKGLFVIATCLAMASTLHAQCLHGNCVTGIGTYLYPSGAKYSGQFLNSKINGNGTLWMNNGNIYSGQWNNNYREGKGKMIFKNEDVFVGEFFHSKMQGLGIMKFSLGGQYSGEWMEDLPHGKGKYIYSNGETYEGLLTYGKRNGYGKYRYEDGSIYDGQWHDNQREGLGNLVQRDGKKLAGLWQSDQFLQNQAVPASSYQTETTVATINTVKPSSASNNSTSLKNCNEERCIYGMGFYVYKDGSKYVGPFRNGNPYGKGIVYYATGDRYEGEWDDITPQGEGIMYFISGRVFAAIWDKGRPVKALDNRPPLRARPEIKPQVDDETKIWAVIVGVARYNHMPVLKYADDDAYQIYAFLKSPEGGAIPDNQIKVLIDEDASRTKIIDVLQEHYGKADQNDVVLLYYSGHGINGAFLPIDFDGYNNKLYHDEINEIMEHSQAKHKLCMIDACYAGSMTEVKADFSASLNQYYSILNSEKGGTAFMLSCKNKEVSLEDSGLRQGIFSHFLIRGLKGEADLDHNKIVSVQELFNFINNHVRIYTGNLQNPVMEGKYNPNMPVALLR